MTREMNKPDWCGYKGDCNWWQASGGIFCLNCSDLKPKQRKLDDWIKPYIDSINERFKQCGE